MKKETFNLPIPASVNDLAAIAFDSCGRELNFNNDMPTHHCLAKGKKRKKISWE